MSKPSFFMNGNAYGDIADVLLAHEGDVGALRPYIDEDGESYIVLNQGTPNEQILQANAPATLPKDVWIDLDRQIMQVAQARLRAVADLRSRGLVYNVPNGMGKSVIQYQDMSDIGPADVAMDPVKESGNDRPLFTLKNLPLPIIFKDFEFSLRDLLMSKSGQMPLDTSMAQMAGRKVAEEAEKMLLGISTIANAYAYGGGTIYGYTNFPSRITYTITSPTTGGWTPQTLIDEVLDMIQESVDQFHYGPWVLYMGTSWQKFLGNDFSAAKGDNTLRERLMKIENLTDVRTLDFLTGYQILLIEMVPENVREVIGMDVMTVQWDTHGGLKKHWKVMAMMVPQIRTDYNSTTGIVHGSP